MAEIQGARIHITGTVQGVGFRPFVYGLAARLGLTGWVRNTSAGVDIVVDGSPADLKSFLDALQSDAPPLARIDTLESETIPANGYTTFEIEHSEPIEGAFQPISPDVCICQDCLREMLDPHDRRYRYPFINCTNCGPRFTIIQDIPYDRPRTTMAEFELCPDCAHEYTNPLDRRFHAQPVACPECGPKIWVERSSQLSAISYQLNTTTPLSPAPLSPEGNEALREVQKLLLEGKIVAIKGLGGFHLACDAMNSEAVAELRRRKLRVDKPFALMMPDVKAVEQYCYVGPQERELLESRQRPIVILKRRPGSPIAAEVAPEQDTVGIMLPYTPLHYLLFMPVPSQPAPGYSALVMTSGNLSEEPIATDNEEARQRLAPLADAFLMHDRPIHVRCDDSVARVAPLDPPPPTILRRSRGYAPAPLMLPFDSPPLLAAGAELKNTFCLARDRYAFLSHHIGDLENYETLQSFEQGIEHYERLFRVKPEVLAYDLHPNYLATRYALERSEREGLLAVGVQHHHAHIAACMADNHLTGEDQVIGVSFDGTGYGEDGAIWGGEFLLADYRSFRRFAHLAYIPLPGGDAAVRKPARAALAHLWQNELEWDPKLSSVQALSVAERQALRAQLEHRLNAPLTSSMGRLFDAAAALAGIRQTVNYEAQAAIEFEALANPDETGAYTFDYVRSPEATLTVHPGPVISTLVRDFLAGVPAPIISSRFHNGVAWMVLEICQKARQESSLRRVAFSGGVWQNMTLLSKSVALLQAADFEILLHNQVPPNDGGLALGQAAIAAMKTNIRD